MRSYFVHSMDEFLTRVSRDLFLNGRSVVIDGSRRIFLGPIKVVLLDPSRAVLKKTCFPGYEEKIVRIQQEISEEKDVFKSTIIDLRRGRLDLVQEFIEGFKTEILKIPSKSFVNAEEIGMFSRSGSCSLLKDFVFDVVKICAVQAVLSEETGFTPMGKNIFEVKGLYVEEETIGVLERFEG